MGCPLLLALYPSLLAWQVRTFGPAQILMSLYPKNSGRATHDWRRTRSSGGTANLPDSKLCQDRQNVLLLSVVSVWEMQIKRQLGKLRLALPLKEIIET